MWGILTLVATWAFLYEGKEWQASERFGVAAAVLSNVGCDLAVAVGVATERRLLTYSTLLVGAVQVAPRRCACAWQACQGTGARLLRALVLVASSSRSRMPTSPKLKVSKSSGLQIGLCRLVHHQVSMPALSLRAASPCVHSCSALWHVH